MSLSWIRVHLRLSGEGRSCRIISAVETRSFNSLDSGCALSRVLYWSQRFIYTKLDSPCLFEIQAASGSFSYVLCTGPKDLIINFPGSKYSPPNLAPKCLFFFVLLPSQALTYAITRHLDIYYPQRLNLLWDLPLLSCQLLWLIQKPRLKCLFFSPFQSCHTLSICSCKTFINSKDLLINRPSSSLLWNPSPASLPSLMT